MNSRMFTVSRIPHLYVSNFFYLKKSHCFTSEETALSEFKPLPRSDEGDFNNACGFGGKTTEAKSYP